MKKLKIVFLDSATMGDVTFAPISRHGDLTLYDSSTPEQAKERISDCDVVIINKIIMNRELIDAGKNLKMICEAATGVNNIDLDYAASKGIPVRNAVGYSTDSVVQSTFMHILSLCGHAPYYDNFVKSGKYSASRMFTDVSVNWFELADKTIGIIGMGNIGVKVAKVAEAFGMKVVYFSTSGISHCTDYPSLPLDRLLAESDIVSVHAPLNERTKGLIGVQELSKMKPTAILVNAGRGGIVDEAALAQAIDSETIAGAALDVFATEPLPADSPLLTVQNADRLRLAPHVAWASREARQRLADQIGRNISELSE